MIFVFLFLTYFTPYNYFLFLFFNKHSLSIQARYLAIYLVIQWVYNESKTISAFWGTKAEVYRKRDQKPLSYFPNLLSVCLFAYLFIHPSLSLWLWLCLHLRQNHPSHLGPYLPSHMQTTFQRAIFENHALKIREKNEKTCIRWFPSSQL